MVKIVRKLACQFDAKKSNLAICIPVQTKNSPFTLQPGSMNPIV